MRYVHVPNIRVVRVSKKTSIITDKIASVTEQCNKQKNVTIYMCDDCTRRLALTSARASASLRLRHRRQCRAVATPS